MMMKIFLTGLILLLSACSTVQKTNESKGAYYQDDGPHQQNQLIQKQKKYGAHHFQLLPFKIGY